VAGYESKAPYKDDVASVTEIRQTLGVDYVLEGSVRRVGDRVRVAARLVRTSDRAQLWAGEYDRRVVDLLGLQREVGETMARALALRILPGAAPPPAAATSPQVYDLYLEGRRLLRQEGSDSADLGLAAFGRAIAIDPGFAPAYAGLATAHAQRRVVPGDRLPEARDAALKALALDDSLADAHLLLGDILFYYDLDPEGARREYERAIEIDPGFAEAHHAYAAYFSVAGRHDEALEQVRQARDVDPLSPMVNSDVGWYYYFARRYDEAIAESRRTLRLSPGFYWAGRCILFASLQKGDLAGAAAEAKDELGGAAASGQPTPSLEGLAPSEVLRAFWRWDLTRRKVGPLTRSPADLGMIHVALGEYAPALAGFETAYEERFGWMLPFLRVEPMVDPLRKDARFGRLMARIEAPRGSLASAASPRRY